MKKRYKLKLFLLLLLVIAILYGSTYIPQRIVTVSPKKVVKIEVRNGNNGELTIIDNRDELDYIINNLNQVTFQKGKLSFMYMGYTYRVKFYNKHEKVIEDVTINSESLVRYKGFFYTATKNEINKTYLDKLIR